MIIKQKEGVSRIVCEGTEALLARAELILGPLAFGDIAVQGNGQQLSLAPEGTDAHLNGKHRSILSAMTTVVDHDFPISETLSNALQKRRCQIWPIVERGHPDQFVAAIAQVLARLPIHIENGRILVIEKECIGCVVHQGAEARLARAPLMLRMPQLRDVLHDAKLAQWPPRVVPGDISLATYDSLRAVRTHQPVFHVIARTALH